MSARSDKYDSIINLPHHVSPTHPPMQMETRAAQFAPFAALTGHSDALNEMTRLTSRIIDLTDDERYELSRRIGRLGEIAGRQPIVTVTYFEPDETKRGGRYRNFTGVLKRVDDSNRQLVFTSGKHIDITAIVNIILSHGDR